MRLFGNLNRSTDIQQQDSNALTIARLTKAFACQVDALAKLRRRREQRVVVEHVYVFPGGQAIVGTVNTGSPPALTQNQRQPHATEETAIAAPETEPVRSEDAERQTMSDSPGERAAKVPNARRRTRLRRPIR